MSRRTNKTRCTLAATFGPRVNQANQHNHSLRAFSVAEDRFHAANHGNNSRGKQRERALPLVPFFPSLFFLFSTSANDPWNLLSFFSFSLLLFVLARDSTLKRRGGEGVVFESRFEREDPLDIIGVIVSNGRRKNVWKNVWVEEG